MVGFERIGGPDIGWETGAISSITVAIGDVLAIDRSNEVLILATNTTSREDVAGIAKESRTTADTQVLFEPIDPRSKYRWGTTNNSDTAHNFHRQVLSDEDQVNNTGTDSTSDAALVEQRGTIGATSDKTAWGYFIGFMDRA